MKLGVIARAEDRGLGIQTWEAANHLHPDRVLIVDPGERTQGFPMHIDRYRGHEYMVTRWEHDRLPRRDLADFLDGLDAVWSAETFYDPDLPALGPHRVTVLHVNPEFWVPRPPAPTQVWTATAWRLFQIRPARMVPHPVALERFRDLRRPDDGEEVLKVLHVVGRPAVADRNGTQTFLDALRHVRERVRVTVTLQGRPEDFRLSTYPRNVELHMAGQRGNYWDLYDDQHLLVMPRKFGGLCLPVQEACAAGLAVVMTDCSPNRQWTRQLVAPTHSFPLTVPAGVVAAHEVDPRTLAAHIDRLAADRGLLAAARAHSRNIAACLDWAILAPQWRAIIGDLL